MSALAGFAIHDLQPSVPALLQDALLGLEKKQKSIPAKYFYDQRGSQLFEEICKLPEYYPTRTEILILQTYIGEITAYMGKTNLLIELGSGSGIKTRLLLQATRPAAYFPVDISREQLLSASTVLAQEFPDIPITAVCADYTASFGLPELGPLRMVPRRIFFPGSTIGNFTPNEARLFLRSLHHLAQETGGLLIGVDLKKKKLLLEAAYNDTQGVTAAFNLNLLTRLNRELNANFNLHAFQHQAFYNEEEGRVEMHLVSIREQVVTICGRRFEFKPGESIHTENSYKYTPEEFRELAEGAGFRSRAIWCDDRNLFSVHYFTTTT